MAAAKRAAQEGVAVPLVAASLVGEGAAAGLAAQLEREGARPAGREAGTATAETRAESACSVALAAAGASGDCSTRSWVARSATWQQRERLERFTQQFFGFGSYPKTQEVAILAVTVPHRGC